MLDELAEILRRIGETAQIFRQARIQIPRPLGAEDLVHNLHGIVKRVVGIAGVHLIGTDRVAHFIDHIAAIQGVQNAQEEVQVHLQAGLGVGLAQSAGLLKEQDAEALEPRIAQRQPVFGFVHPETAGAACAGREEYVPVDDLFLRHPFRFKGLQVLHQVAHGEISGVALPVVAVLLAGLKSLHVGRGHRTRLVAEAL